MENNNKTQAELYREERKARLAKEAAKKAKKSPVGEKAKKIATKIIAIVLAVVIGLGAIYASLDFFGVPQKVLKVSVDNTEYKFTLAEFNFYYYSMVMNYTQTAYQYETYYGAGSGLNYLGYDYKKTPDNQVFKDDYADLCGYSIEDIGSPKDPTWEDVFKYATIEQMIQVKYANEKAKELKLTLTEEEQKEITESIDKLKSTAKSNDYSLDRYLRANYGNGITEKLITKIYEEQAMATSYFTKIQNDTLDAITDDEINKEYSENKNTYNIVDLRLYGIAVEADVAKDATAEEKKAAETKADAEAKARADAMLKEITDEKTFINQVKLDLKVNEPDDDDYDAEKATAATGVAYANLEGASEDIAKWVYDSSRKVGDKTVIKADDTYYVIFMVKLPYKDSTVVSNDVRHILIQFPEKNTDGSSTTVKDENGKETTNITKETKAETKKKAEAILEEYKKNPTEENFIALAKEKSEDTGSKQNGGLIEGVADDGKYVEAFTNWAVNTSRKAGDTGVVETEYGYHVMYYVKAGKQTWYENVKNAIFNERYTALTEEALSKLYSNIDADTLLVNWSADDQNELIGRIILYNFS